MVQVGADEASDESEVNVELQMDFFKYACKFVALHAKDRLDLQASSSFQQTWKLRPH